MGKVELQLVQNRSQHEFDKNTEKISCKLYEFYIHMVGR